MACFRDKYDVIVGRSLIDTELDGATGPHLSIPRNSRTTAAVVLVSRSIRN